MDFKQLVMNEVDTKYQEMSKGTTDKPFAQTPTVSSNSTYEKKREDYYRRLNREHSEFNKAVNQIVNTRNARLKSEDQKRREKERKRAERSAATKKFIKTVLVLAIIGGALAALIGLVIWPKMIYPNMDADSLYTPEILQSYSGSYKTGRTEGTAVVTFTECSQSGKLSGYFEFFVGNTYGKYEISGQITEKKKSNNLELTITAGEWVLHPDSYDPLDTMTVEITDNYQSFECSQFNMHWSVGANDEYVIKTADDLKKLAGSGATFQLKNDIDLSGKKWTPIEGFTGTLLGNGYTISNLTIESSSSNVGFFATLEGMIKDIKFENASIKVTGTNEKIGIVCGTLSGNLSGIRVSGSVEAVSSTNVGGMVGYLDLSSKYLAFSGLENAASVTGQNHVVGVFGHIYNSYGSSSATTQLDGFINSGRIISTGDCVGGTIGYIYAKTLLYISDFQNTGDVKGVTNVGGVIGYANGYDSGSYIQNSSCSASIEGEAVIGCIAGSAIDITINNCTNSGSVLKAYGYLTEDGNKNAYIGGFVGKGQFANNCTNEVDIDYTAGGSYVGGVIGYTNISYKNVSMTNLSNKANVNGAKCVGGIIGYFYNSYGSSSATTQFSKFSNSGNVIGTGDYVGGTIGYIYAKTVFYISDFNNSGNVKGVTNVGGVIGYANGYDSGSYIQNSSCSAAVEGEAIIGCIAGSAIDITVNNCSNSGSTLKANGYLTEDGNKNAYVGGFVGKGQFANNCTNEVDINYTAGGSYVGGVIGYTNVSYKNISMTNLSNNANIVGNKFVGGIIGYLHNSYGSSSATTQFDKFTNTGTVTGSEDYVGGTIGYVYAKTLLYISDFKNTGAIKGSTYVGGVVGYADGYDSGSYIQNSSCSASVEGKALVGCIAGAAIDVSINNCTNAGSTLKATGYITDNGNKYAYVGGFVGKGQFANNCTNEVDINYTAGGSYVGGVIGYTNVSYKNISMTNLSNKANISGAKYVGGIIGYLHNSYGSSSATTQLVKFNNSGKVTGSEDYVGGTIGYIYAKTKLYITDCTNTGAVIGGNPVGGVIGYASGYSGSYVQSSTSVTGAIIGKSENVDIK